jgi:hypothetical protein
MKLRQLIAYKNALQPYNVADIRTDANMELQRIMHAVDLSGFDFLSGLALEKDIDCINSAFESFKYNLEQLKTQINQEIKIEEKTAYEEAQEWYQDELNQKSIEVLLNRHVKISDSSQQVILDRIRYYSDWRYPGVIIRPGNRDLIDHLVNYDPLYLVDIDTKLLSPTLEKFTEQYQQRLVCCVVDEIDSQEIFSKLPNNQIGFCVAVDYFNFKPVPVIRRYMTELFEKLRPGGTLAFTVTDSDHVPALLLTERKFACYTPGSAIIDAAEEIGYDLAYQYHSNGEPVTWLEFRKPGSLTSLRGGQTLAKIIPKTLAES